MVRQEIMTDRAYMRILREFKRLREQNKASQKEIEIESGSGGGRVSLFESMNYTPRLTTFVRWCRAAGIDITLTRKKKLQEDPAAIIDEIKAKKNKP